MHTTFWSAEQARTGIQEAAAALAAGGVVAFPTETVYGLGGDARSTEAVKRIFEAKGRPSDNPLIVHLADEAEVFELAERVNDVEKALMAAFWPGPLTLVLPVKAGAVSSLVTAGLDTVAVRVPAHELARELIGRSGCPLAAPSANRSGRPSPTRASHVLEDLDGRIDGILDGGETGVGLESTVVRVLDGIVHILRPGGVTKEQLQEAVGATADIVSPENDAKVTTSSSEPDSDSEQAPRSPGTKYAHYAPRGEMIVFSGPQEMLVEAIQAKTDETAKLGRRIAVLCCSEHAGLYREAEAVFDCGERGNPEQAARALYARLRECDERGLDFILAEGYPEEGIGAALMNRLRKAAGGREIVVR
ncbi:threonylcarbamoyl-AMP synthase [Cohnella endophytica]|uniref:Threonylcarbamoyl-AMP synthase n=1 Tax=Cohnella endophytica TaxID=2419778 RepID=A0A494XA87_9BACL|nr:L-threonylcarbamoyladenylate synthase [Cohnella endophytica]RKP47390.1 threonylcarbamoyl-AMP synthase [Cohnella endophytica]